GIPAFLLEPDLDGEILEVLLRHRADIVFLAGYLKKIGPAVLSAFGGRIFNIHPSLLPRHGGRGMYGINVHRAVLASGETETGITIHRVSAEYDTGPIVAQRKVPVLPEDTPESLAARVLAEEHRFIVEVLGGMLRHPEDGGTPGTPPRRN
ncbi:MAG: phosphoribosylglycinamide formyltransferase, partial [Treponema sp.]|nr:phosphoribosylglycinamide formyltransferase [Treponema sp.]